MDDTVDTVKRDQAFQDFWDKTAYPGIVNSPASFILMRHIDDIKKASITEWNACWEACINSLKS